MACHDTCHFYFKLNLIINQLEHIVDRVMVPLNRVFPSAATFASMGRPLFGPLSCLWSVPPTREGYGCAVPWPGKQTQPCVPVDVVMVPCPRLGPFYHDVADLPRRWPLMSGIDTGPPMT